MDQNEITYITADGGVYNYKTGVNQFDGHVRIDQGTTHVTADRLITKSNHQHKIEQAIAYGLSSSAHYWTLLKNDDPEFHAQAKIIRYFPLASNVTLEHAAIVTQGTNSFHGELIHYNSANQTIAVPALEKNQAVLIYNPDN
jgi:lipopolysaccharide export system protein LptA